MKYLLVVDGKRVLGERNEIRDVHNWKHWRWEIISAWVNRNNPKTLTCVRWVNSIKLDFHSHSQIAAAFPEFINPLHPESELLMSRTLGFIGKFISMNFIRMKFLLTAPLRFTGRIFVVRIIDWDTFLRFIFFALNHKEYLHISFAIIVKIDREPIVGFLSKEKERRNKK